jgi:secondary thiamine-phosphate synthase enzyme
VRTITLETRARREFREITAEVAAAVTATGIEEGVAFLWCPHTTAGITVNENADPDVVRDFLCHLERLVPKDGDFRHGEGNSDAHIQSVLTGPGQAIPVAGGRLALGTWQGVFFTEYDGPRRRRVFVQVLGG